jgi:hypothetical protein
MTLPPDATGLAQPPMLMQPLPDDFRQLSWRQRRQLRKMQASEQKSVWDWEKAQKQWDKAQRVEMEKKNKEVYKMRKAELKSVSGMLGCGRMLIAGPRRRSSRRTGRTHTAPCRLPRLPRPHPPLPLSLLRLQRNRMPSG